MGDSANAGWRLCKCYFIFEWTNEPVENAFLHTTQYGCIVSDPTAKPYSKHFSNRDDLSVVQDANSHEAAKLQVPSVLAWVNLEKASSISDKHVSIDRNTHK